MEILKLKTHSLTFSIQQSRRDVQEENINCKSVHKSQGEGWKIGFLKSIKAAWDTEKRSNIHVTETTEGEERENRAETTFNEKRTEHFPD